MREKNVQNQTQICRHAFEMTWIKVLKQKKACFTQLHLIKLTNISGLNYVAAENSVFKHILSFHNGDCDMIK